MTVDGLPCSAVALRDVAEDRRSAATERRRCGLQLSTIGGVLRRIQWI
jgi:hypothetical protein